MAKPEQPVIMRLINNVIGWVYKVQKKQGMPISDIKLDFDEVITGTGPSAFTEAILAEMSARSGRTVTRETFHNLAESKLIEGILVLTIEAFAAGQGHSDSGNHDARTALVKHHYHASMWPSSHPRYSHPMYGEVEQCNWDSDCIRSWDENVKNYNALPKEEQIRQITTKQALDAI